MYIYIKNKHDLLWRDITKYVDLPIIIYDTKDGKDTSAKLNVFFDDNFKLFDITKPIPPKTYVKISEVDDEELENDSNTYWFQISKSNSIKQRKSVKDSYGNDIVRELWEHVLELSEYITILNETHMPNYTITQPKSEFFDMYRRVRGARFDIGHYFEQNGENMTLPMGSKRYVNEARHEGKIVLDYKDNKHYVEIKDINKLSYDLDISIDLMKSAPSKTQYTMLWQRNINITAHSSKGVLLPITKINNSTTRVQTRITYYDINDNVIRMYGESFEIKSNGANVSNDYNIISGISKITGFISAPQTNTFNINLPKDINADRVVVDFTYYNDEEWMNFDGRLLEYDDGSFQSDNVVGFLDNITIQATSEAHTEEFEEDFITYYDFLEKATFDYNLNKRDKITLNEDLRTVLSEVAKEGEWVDFTYKELVERLFKYVGIVPTLSFDNVLSYVKTQHVGVNLDEEFQQSEEKEHVGDDFFDTILSNSKNLVSEKDFVKEYLSLSSLSDEFEQITSSNLGFLTSKNIYYVANGIINIPNLEFDFSEWGGGIINTNMNKPYHWDITTRLFERDIYDSFPNVRFDGAEGGRARFDLFSKGNTLYYTSGDNVVSGLGHQADSVPTYNVFSESTLTDDGQYAIIETLIVLAISQIPSESIALEVAKNYKKEFTLQDFEYQNMALELTYAPIFKELTTKYVSNMTDRRGLKSEKKVNMNERVISYQESEEVLRREMDRKGNVKEMYSENYNTLSEVLPNLSIIEGNKYITSKVINLDNNVIGVEYILQKDFIMESDDIRLGVEFERYNVPYEYVSREIIIENHLMFNNRKHSRYGADESGITKNFIEQMLIPNGNDWNNPIYSNSLIETVSEKVNAMTRVGKIENRFSMILSGEYLDNYTAGTQRYLNTAGGRLLFSQPFRYTDTTGKFESVKDLVIGWNDVNHNSRLSTDINDINLFPNGKDIELDYKLFEDDEVVAIRKDGREKISYNLSSYLISENDNIKWYSFSPILKVGALVKDYNFIDDMKLEDVDYELIDSELDITINDVGLNRYEVNVVLDDDYRDMFDKGMVFIGEYRGSDILVGLLKDPLYISNGIRFYVSATRYGYWGVESYSSDMKGNLTLKGNLNKLKIEDKQINPKGSFGIKGNMFYTKIMFKGTTLYGNIYTKNDIEYTLDKIIGREHYGSQSFKGYTNTIMKKKQLKEINLKGSLNLDNKTSVVKAKLIEKELSVGGELSLVNSLKKIKREEGFISTNVKGKGSLGSYNTNNMIKYKGIERKYNQDFVLNGIINYNKFENKKKDLVNKLKMTNYFNYMLVKLEEREKELNGSLNIGSKVLYSKREENFFSKSLMGSSEVKGGIPYKTTKYKGIEKEYNNKFNLGGETSYNMLKDKRVDLKGSLDLKANNNFIFGHKEIKNETISGRLLINSNIRMVKREEDFINSQLYGGVGLESELNYNTIKYTGIERSYNNNLGLSGNLEYKPLYIKGGDINGSLNVLGGLEFNKNKKELKQKVLENNIAINGVLESELRKSRSPIIKPLNGAVSLNGTSSKNKIENPKPVSISKPGVVGNPTCENIGGTTYIRLTVRNNHNEPVSISINGTTVTTNLNANSTRSVILAYQLPGLYRLSIKAFRNVGGKREESDALNLNGNIAFCILG